MKETTMKSTIAVAFALVAAAASADSVQVTVDGNPVRFEAAQPRMIDGRVFVPLRGVFEKMGADVNWDPSTQSVTADNKDRHVRLRLGALDASVNGRVVTMDVPPQLNEDTTMVPLRFLGEALGAKVDWQPQNDLVAITSGPPDEGRAERIVQVPVPGPVQIVQAPAPPPKTIIIERPAPPAPPPPFVVSRDIVIPLRLDMALTSNDSHPGDLFSATVRDETGRYLDFPEGTEVQGQVLEATPASGSHGGTLDVRFTHIKFPDGARYQIGGVVARWNDKEVVRTDNGKYVASAKVDRSLYADNHSGPGAVLLMGSLNGKVTGGSALGGSFGTIIGSLDHGMAHNVIFDKGARLALILNQDLTINPKDLNGGR